MKKNLIILAACGLLLLTACQKENISVTPQGHKTITFNCSGDWQQDLKDLSANGTAMTDIWVFDYVGNELQQDIHQNDNTAADFGSPSVNLSYGTHTLYFVVSRGLTPTVNTTSHTISWVKPSDTFFKTVTLTVDANTGAQAVTLDRSVAKLRMTINDDIATGVTQFLVTPATWYYGLDYFTGDPTNAATNQAITLDCPAAYVGQSGKFMTVYTFSSTTQWTTNVTLTASDGTNTISSVTIPNVPLQRNYSTEFSGNLFTTGSGMTLSLNDTWTGTHTGSW